MREQNRFRRDETAIGEEFHSRAASLPQCARQFRVGWNIGAQRLGILPLDDEHHSHMNSAPSAPSEFFHVAPATLRGRIGEERAAALNERH